MKAQTKITPSNLDIFPSRNSCILVVDDEEQNRVLLKDPLEAKGYEVVEAQNGAQALEMVLQHPPDVVLLDVMMPKMDGFEVCRTLRRHPRTVHLPILMVTALSERTERLTGIEAGANDFITKPLDLQDVLLRVSNASLMKQLFDQVQLEKDKYNTLLNSVLPLPIAERMKRGQTHIADYHSSVSVLFADLVGFTSLSTSIGPEQVVELLNEIFSSFDELVNQHGLEKIKTIGDAYMAVGGAPVPRVDHAKATAELALDMQNQMVLFNQQYATSISIRIGIATGPVVAGIIGRGRLSYDLWGDTVNLASRLETLGDPQSIHVAPSTFEILREHYRLEPQLLMGRKESEQIDSYRLNGRH